MIRTVYDTNVLASGAAATRGILFAIIDPLTTGRITLVISFHIVEELENTLTKPYFMSRMRSKDIDTFLSLMSRVADVIPITLTVQGIATHPEDDLVLVTALSGNADYLVTGDKGLLNVGSYRGVTIVTPRAFLDVLDNDSGYTTTSST